MAIRYFPGGMPLALAPWHREAAIPGIVIRHFDIASWLSRCLAGHRAEIECKLVTVRGFVHLTPLLKHAGYPDIVTAATPCEANDTHHH